MKLFEISTSVPAEKCFEKLYQSCGSVAKMSPFFCVPSAFHEGIYPFHKSMKPLNVSLRFRNSMPHTVVS